MSATEGRHRKERAHAEAAKAPTGRHRIESIAGAEEPPHAETPPHTEVLPTADTVAVADPGADPEGWHGAEAVPAQRRSAEAYPQIIYLPPARRRRWPMVVLTLVGILAVLTTAGVWVTAPFRAQWRASIAEPRSGEVAGLTIMPESEELTDELKRDVDRYIDIRDTYGAFLEDPNARADPIVLAVATGLFWTPARDLTAAMREITKGSRVEDFPPGPLGGHLRCGGFTADSAGLVIACGWIDHGSVGIAMFLGSGRSMDECAAKLRAIRAEVITRR